MSFFYDTHIHLDLFPNMEEIIAAIEHNKIYTIAVTNLPPLYLRLSQKLDSKFIRPALGFHPELLSKYEHHIPLMWQLLPKCKYIGEVGLDYKSGDNKALQQSFFEELIHRCNKEGDKILSVHTRNSAKDALSIIGENFNGTSILHWFSGDSSSIEKGINQGCYFSINYAMCTSKKGEDLISKVPRNRLLIETDAPFVRSNNSSFAPQDIPEIIAKISEIWGEGVDKAQKQLWSNFDMLIRGKKKV